MVEEKTKLEKSEIPGLNIHRIGQLEVMVPEGITVMCIMCFKRPCEGNTGQCKECNEEERKWRESKKKNE